VTNATGGIVEESDFYPFGGERVITDSLDNNYKFTGKEREVESGLDYFGARHYASTLGRFLQTDPVSAISPRAAVVFNPQRWNAYGYAVNNPLIFTDVDGRFSAQVHTSITQTAATNMGYSQATVKVLVGANLNVDRLTNFSNNKQHGISGFFSKTQEGLNKIHASINASKNEAVDKAVKGDYKGAAKALGEGLHTAQDLAAHQGGTLAGHGRDESKNDNDPNKTSQAQNQSEQFLKSFEAAVIKAVGPEKGAEIINQVKKAGENSESDEQGEKEKEGEEPAVSNDPKEKKSKPKGK